MTDRESHAELIERLHQRPRSALNPEKVRLMKGDFAIAITGEGPLLAITEDEDDTGLVSFVFSGCCGPKAGQALATLLLIVQRPSLALTHHRAWEMNYVTPS